MNVLDLSIVSRQLATKCHWYVHNDTLGSDHFPTFTSINQHPCLQNSLESKWNYAKADWIKFKKTCSEDSIELPPSNIEEHEEQIRKYIINAATSSIPVKQINYQQPKSVPYWDDVCTTRIKDRNVAQNKMNNTRDLNDIINYKRLKALAQRDLKSKAKEYWQQYCSSLNNNTKLGSVWNMARKMNGVQSNRSMPSLQLGQRTADTNIEKADMLANVFESNSSDAHYSASFIQQKNISESDGIFSSDESDINQQLIPLNEEFQIHELLTTINGLKNKVAPGPDHISNEMIKQLPMRGVEKLLVLYNATWKSGVVPSAWRHAPILPFAKPDKDATNPDNYRPISLTSCLCKLMEKMITERLTFHLETNNILNAAQTGFRKNRSTTDQIIKLQDKILKQMKNKGCTIGVFLDFEKAYMSWRGGLMHKLKNMGINGQMFQWIKSFINNRTFQVRVGISKSSIHTLHNGTPQGSVISPVLFLCMINDINTNLKEVDLSLFADDSAVYTCGKDINRLGNFMQQTLDYIQIWCDRWGFKISPGKSTGVIFTQKLKCILKKPLKINGTILKMENQVKFLGMIFDSKLSWNNHIQFIEKKCLARLNLMRSLSGNKWGASKTTLLTLYRMLIRPILDYGAIAYDSTSKSSKKRLDTIQYKALRICCSSMVGTSGIAMQNECGELPLHLRRKMYLLQYGAKIKTTINHPSKEIRRFNDCATGLAR